MRHRIRVVPVRRRRLGFAFALVAALVSGGWNDCCCYTPLRLADPVGWGPRKQPFLGDAYYLYSYDAGPSLGTVIGSKGWGTSLRVGAAWTRAGDLTYEGKSLFVTSLARENDEYSYVGSQYGLIGTSLTHGTVRSFTGLPSSDPGIWSLQKRFQGGVYAGLDVASGAGIPLLYQCEIGTSGNACTPAPGGPVSTKAGDGMWAIRSFGGAYYALSTLGMRSSPNGLTYFQESTPAVSNYDIGGEDGSLVTTTQSGVYKGPGRGMPWTLDNTGLGTGCAGVTYVDQKFYVACNYPSLQVYSRFKTDTSWTSTNLSLAAYGFNLEKDGSDVVFGTTRGPWRYHLGVWAADDDCFGRSSTVLSVMWDGQTVAAGGSLTGFAESADKGQAWTSDPSSFRLSAQYVAKNSLGTYVTGSTGTYYRPAGQPAFQQITGAAANASALGTAGDVVLAGLASGGVGRFNGNTFQAANTGFDTSAYVNGFASNGSTAVTLTNKGNWFSPSASLSWTKGANRSDGQPFVGLSGAALQGGDYLLGGYANPSGWNIARSNAAGTSLARAGVGIPDGATVWHLAEVSNAGTNARFEPGRRSAAIVTALVAATSRGLYVSYDDASSWSLLSKDLGTTPVYGLAPATDRLWVATARGLRSYSLPLQFRRLVPIVLDVDTGTAHYTTELALTNPGSTAANVTLQYTAALGSGSATVSDTLAAGRQLVIPDVLSYLRGKGATIPVGGSQGGTLLLTFSNVSAESVPAVTARTGAATGAPLPVGRAGLAYGAHDPDEGSRGTLTVYGLRSNATDRSNVAVYNTSNEDVTFRVTAYSGAGGGASAVVADSDTLPPWGWKQYSRILEGPGYAQGWVSVARTSMTGSFGIYGVVNDNTTNDGSLLFAGANPAVPAYTNVPVLVETGAFLSELVLANADTAAAVFHLTYRESLAGSGGGSTDVSVPAKSQLIIPSVIAYLRSHGVAIGAAGAGSYGGSLHVEVSGASPANTWVGARTSAPTPAGGQFGLFTPSAAPGSEGDVSATINGLRADAENRSNVAAVNTGDPDDGAITLSIQAYDGDAGGVARGAPAVLVLAPGQWSQLNNFLGSVGVANGWVKVTRTAGFAPWIAYGVVNDGGAPGQRTSDGAYVAMVK